MIIRSFIMSLVLAMAVSIIGCSSSINNNSGKTTKFPKGKALYISKCTACHKTYERELYTVEEWNNILKEMGNKAKLTTEEKESILNYLYERN